MFQGDVSFIRCVWIEQICLFTLSLSEQVSSKQYFYFPCLPLEIRNINKLPTIRFGFFSEELPAADSCVAAISGLVAEPTVRVMHFSSFKDSKFSVFQAVKPAGQERQSIHVLFPESKVFYS